MKPNSIRFDMRNDNRGIALVSLLIILSALTVLSLGLIVFSRTEMQISDNDKNHTSALFVTEAGVQEVVTRLGLRTGTNVTVNGATFDAAIGDDPTNPTPTWKTQVYLARRQDLPAAPAGVTVVPTVQSNANWLHYGDTNLGLTPITVQHKWVDLNGNGVREANELVRYDSSRFPPENYTAGQLIEQISTTGIVNGARRQILAEVMRIPLTCNVTAAISSDNGVDLTGNMTGCGHNHSINTPVGTKDPACRNFELCTNRTQDAVAGCLVAVMTTGDVAQTGGSANLGGFPAWSDTSSVNTFRTAYDYLGITQDQWNQILAHPDHTSSHDPAPMQGITYINGNATGGNKFNNTNGTGLIYVTGDCDISGNFNWKGLIYVEGNCHITGTAWILGAICVRGTTSTNAFGAGNATILYCRDAITQYVGGAMGYQTLAWKEQ